MKSLILKPSRSIVDQVFSLTEVGDLDELKQLTRTIPPQNLVEMSSPGRRSILIFAVDCERRDIVRWLVQEKKADVNAVFTNETALQRAIYRNNEAILRDLIGFGADLNHLVPQINFNMTMYAVHRGKPRLLDAILEAGASTQIMANGIPVIDQYVKTDKAIH